MSNVEKFFYQTQGKLGGNAKWEDLDPIAQMRFVEAVNVILHLCSAQLHEEQTDV